MKDSGSNNGIQTKWKALVADYVIPNETASVPKTAERGACTVVSNGHMKLAALLIIMG